jgi:hypothetical protein
MPVHAVPAGRRKIVFGAYVGVLFQKAVFIADDVAVELQLAGDEGLLRHMKFLPDGLAGNRFAAGLFPQAHPSGVHIQEFKAADGRLEQRVLQQGDKRDPGRATHLPVRDGLYTRGLLQFYGLQHRLVFQPPQFLGVYGTFAHTLFGLGQIIGT